MIQAPCRRASENMPRTLLPTIDTHKNGGNITWHISYNLILPVRIRLTKTEYSYMYVHYRQNIAGYTLIHKMAPLKKEAMTLCDPLATPKQNTHDKYTLPHIKPAETHVPIRSSHLSPLPVNLLTKSAAWAYSMWTSGRLISFTMDLASRLFPTPGACEGSQQDAMWNGRQDEEHVNSSLSSVQLGISESYVHCTSCCCWK